MTARPEADALDLDFDSLLPTEEEGLLSDPMTVRLERLRAFDPQARPAATALLRRFMEALDSPAVCGRSSCLRSGRCRGPKVDCFWLDLPVARAALRLVLSSFLARGRAD